MANQYRSVLASGGAGTGGDAVAANVLAGKTFTNDNGFDTGTMVNNGAVTQTLSAGQSYTIPEGYHNGNGVITADQVTLSPDVKVQESASTTISAIVDKHYALGFTSDGGYAPSSITGATVLARGTMNYSGGGAAVLIVKATATTMDLGSFTKCTVIQLD